MTHEQWQRTKDVTADAFELDPPARAAFVREACGRDPEVEREVMRLLAESEPSDDSFVPTAPVNLRSLLAQLQPSAPCFAQGQIVAGRFRIERFLNRGGMGEVYRATDLELQEPVALKTISPDIAMFADAIGQFKREVKESRRIADPGVCRVYDLFSHEQPAGDPIWFLTMELLEGRSLAEYLASEGAIPARQAIPLIRDMADALAAAHELGIVHRDFKPSNIMLVQGPARLRAVVTDFGLALNLSRDEAALRAGAADGTPAYKAPEQMAGGTVGLAADQYALGLVICEMLTGTRPALDRLSAEESRRQLSEWLNGQSNQKLNPRLRRVLRRCLEFRPERRFRRVRDIVVALDGSRARSRRLWVAGVIAAAVIVALALVLAAPDTGPQVIGAIPLTSDSGLATTPAISPDGRWIVYSSDRAESGNQDIWLQRAPGGPAKRVTSYPGVDDDPTVSPDGKLVAFHSERDGGGIYLVNSDGTNEHLLVAGGRSPTFSPDGRWIAFWIGDRDDTAPSGRLYLISPDGSARRQLAADFADARYPTWDSSGRSLLFDGCRTNHAPLAICTDWWVIGAGGGELKSTGALASIKSQRIEIQTPPLKAWHGSQVFFSGAQGSTSSLWTLTLSPRNARPVGIPRRIVSGGSREREPAVSETGAIVFGRTTGALHIWEISPEPEKAPPRAGRITDDPSLDGCPSISADGRWLFFTRKINDVRQLMIRDLDAGRESVVFPGDEDKFWPATAPAGDRVVFEIRRKADSSIWISGRTGQPRRLCSGCAHPTGWFADGKAVFYTTENGEIALLDIADGSSRVILSPGNGTLLGGADWNGKNQYLLFTVERHGAAKQAFAVRFPANAQTPQGPWLQLSNDPAETEQPKWTPDGKRFYFLSKRDGNNCIWGRSFDAIRGSAGPPFSVMHYHDARFTPDRASPLTRGLTVSDRSIFLNIGEVTDTLWMGHLTDSPMGALLRDLRTWR